MKKTTLLAISFFLTYAAAAQESSIGSWNILNIKYSCSERWGFFTETQLRSLKFYDHFHYYEYKGGVNYKASQFVTLTLGAGSYQTYREGGDFITPKNNNEFRIWPQLTLSSSLNSVSMDQRFRIEARYTSNGYKNRYRYRLGFSYPLRNLSPSFENYTLQLNNEIFFTNREAYFERNRLQLSLLWKLNQGNSIQFGYLHQFDYRINDEIGRQFLVLGYYYEISKTFHRNIKSTTLHYTRD
jgi:hypothetical protein